MHGMTIHAHDYTIVQEDEEILDDDEVLEERGRELAIRVHLRAGGTRLRATRPRAIAEQEARILEGLREDQQQTGADGPASA
jgi:hypothetical protein